VAVADDATDYLEALEKDLRLPRGFIWRLLDEDDWSFVIKLHALFEAALTHALVHKLGVEALRDVFAKTELSARKTGKVAFARALELLDKSERRFISELSELRNTLVHDIENVGFKYSKYIERLDAKQRQAFVDAFAFSHDEKFTIAGRQVAADRFALDNPKIATWQTGIWLLRRIYLEKEVAKLTHEASQLLLSAANARIAT
jgi:hypothetical protein